MQTVTAPEQIATPTDTPPLRHSLNEAFSGRYLADLLYNWKSIAPVQATDHRAIVVIPGFCGGELSITALKRFLRKQGYHAYSWGQGFNHGKIHTLFEPLRARIEHIAEKHAAPVTLIGWSLGGILAREITRDHPDFIDEVVTMGSPVIGGPRYTALNPIAARLGWDVEEIEEEIRVRHEQPIEKQISVLYSRNDGIVSWQACMDHWSPKVIHHEVTASHLGMGFSREVFTKLAEILSQSKQP